MPHYTPADFLKARDWVAAHGGGLFPTYSAFDWFTRCNRAELAKSGEVLFRRGAGGTLVGPGFGQLAVEIMQRKQSSAA